MRPIAINFAWHQRQPSRIVGRVALVIAMACAGCLAWAYLQLHSEAKRWQADRQRLDGLVSVPRPLDDPETRERLQAELRLANRVIAKIDTPWDALFGAVESAFGDQVTLLGIEPDTEQREVRLTGEAKDSAAMLDYLRQVRQSPALKEAHLTGHQINAQDSQRPIRFTIQAHWIEPPPAPNVPNEPTAPQPPASQPEAKP
jgi:hypothetical protein